MWKITVNYDSKNSSSADVSAEWTDPAFGIFTHSRRVEATVAGVNAFIAEAIVARNAWQVKRQRDIDGEALVLGKINAADPQAGG